MKKRLQKIMALLLSVTMTVTTVVSPVLAEEGAVTGNILQEEYNFAGDSSTEEEPVVLEEEPLESGTLFDDDASSAQEQELVVEDIIVQEEGTGAEGDFVSGETEEPAAQEEETEFLAPAESEESFDTEKESESSAPEEEPVTEEETDFAETEQIVLMMEEAGEAVAEDLTGQEEDFTYYLYSDENNNVKAAISSYTGTNVTVSIPETVGGYAVGMVGEQAFSYCGVLESIRIPEGVTSIGREAFSSCGGLKSVTLPSSLTEVGARAFNGTALRYVYYGGSQSDWEAIAINADGNDRLINSDNPTSCVRCNDSTGPFTYEVPDTNIRLLCADGETIRIVGCDTESEGELTIPTEINGKAVTGIGDMAFYNCGKLTGVTIPEGVGAIGRYAFYSCGALKSVNIPNGVTAIEEYAFDWCGSLESIRIPEGGDLHRAGGV